MVFNESENQEREYLKRIIFKIKDIISYTDQSVNEHVDTLKQHKAYIWTNKDIDPHEIRSMRESILNHFAIGENVIAKRRRLGKILDIPYFGRIDFREKNKDRSGKPIYIGIHNFYDPVDKINLIYDWRSPISGMFYDYELGEAFYTSPSGKIKGNISLKRQYRIRKGMMEYMLESSLAIHDDILQKELSSGSDVKMKNIVATIQREQNKIIRNNETETLIIQGVAGSGKTSIALHRIAYLLYTQQGKISSKDILIISPNKVFTNYISNVLPELGEENIPETNMEHILSAVLENKYSHQDFFGQVNDLLSKPSAGYIERIRYKSSYEFICLLDKFLLHIENHYFEATDVQLTRLVTIPAGYIDEQFRRFNRYPMRRRFEEMTDYILDWVRINYHITVTTAERNRLRKEMKKMFKGNNDLQLYKDFFKWAGKPEMFRMYKSRMLEYPDLAPVAYLHIALEGVANRTTVKHLLIDEMQDYTPIQYKILQKLYPCRKTILGDANQSVSYGSSTAGMIKKVFVTGEIMKLNKSYRSTSEITNLAQKIWPDNEIEAVARHGDEPCIIGYNTPEEEISGINELIALSKMSADKVTAVICKTERAAKDMFEKIKIYHTDSHFLHNQSAAFVKGVIITSIYMAKGLEFDEVIIPQANQENYRSELDRRMLYVGVTRAMNKVIITYTGKRNEFT